MFLGRAFIQIYHVWEGYLRKILPVERLKISRAEWRGKFSLKTGIFLNLIQPTISLEMPIPSQGHYGFHSFLVVD